MQEDEFVDGIRRQGGQIFIVGGWVRDKILGKNPKDKDYVLCGISEEIFQKNYPQAIKAGKAFPVYRLVIDGEFAEIAFARKEKKSGTGYRGFTVAYDPSVRIEEDLYRRDTTMNALAMELPGNTLLDPFGGQADIRQKIIRAVSPHFLEDPVRALRAARQAAELQFRITENTLALMKACRRELLLEPAERMMGELTRALMAVRPSVFFRQLEKAAILAAVFPEIHALQGKTQPLAFHPEGDAFEHTMKIIDAVAMHTDSLLARFCALAHDLGKGETPSAMLPHHYGHEQRGVDVLRRWNERMKLPKSWMKGAEFVIAEHMRAPRLEKPGKIVDLLINIQKSPLSFVEFNQIILADHGTLPLYLQQAETIAKSLGEVSGNACPEGLRGPAIGTWIHAEQIKRYLLFSKSYL